MTSHAMNQGQPITLSGGTPHWYGLGLEGVPPEVFFTLSFEGHVPRGTVNFHPAFLATA